MSKKQKTMKKSLRRFWEFRIYKPCKIIVIVVAVSVFNASEVKGQAQVPDMVTSEFLRKDIPAFNIVPSAYAKLSASIGRLHPFAKIEQRALLRGEHIAHKHDSYMLTFFGGSQGYFVIERLTTEIQSNNNHFLRINIKTGIDFRVIRNTNIRLALSGERLRDLHFGINNSLHLGGRTRLKTHIGVSRGNTVREITHSGRTYSLPSFHDPIQLPMREWDGQSTVYRNSFSKIKLGSKLKIRLANNLDLRVGLAASRKFTLNPTGSFQNTRVTLFKENILFPETRNIFNFSVGLHKNIPIGVQPQQAQPRPRTRQAPRRQQMAPCPHMQPRPWETVHPFNHPSQPGRNR